jgi:cob(I)alamin adenosyltransferase
MKIYTRTGDAGDTELPDGARLPKDHPRLETIGTLDELNALLGLARSEALPEDIDRLVERLQYELFGLAAELAEAPGVGSQGSGGRRLDPADVRTLEEAIDRYAGPLRPLSQFILPAGTPAAATLHVARAVCRRAERRLVTLARQGEPKTSPTLLAYLNRLSDLLFVLSRAVNSRAGCPEVPWRNDR